MILDNWPPTRSGFSSTAGTTASVVIIKNGRIYVAHCGDSSIAMATQDASQDALSLVMMTEVCNLVFMIILSITLSPQRSQYNVCFLRFGSNSIQALIYNGIKESFFKIS